MNWSDVILSLLALAAVFVLVVLVFVLKSIKQVDNKKASQKQDQSGSQD
jgi:uncharacterized protein YpmS